MKSIAIRHDGGTFANRGGYTLIEVMVGLLVLAFGILGIGAMHIHSMRGNAEARDMTEASNLAMDQLESFMAGGYDSVQASEEPAVRGRYSMEWTVEEDADAENTKTIAITVSWESEGKPRSISMKHIIAAVSQ